MRNEHAPNFRAWQVISAARIAMPELDYLELQALSTAIDMQTGTAFELSQKLYGKDSLLPWNLRVGTAVHIICRHLGWKPHPDQGKWIDALVTWERGPYASQLGEGHATWSIRPAWLGVRDAFLPPCTHFGTDG